MEIRKMMTFVEDTRSEAGVGVDPVLRKVAVVAVVKNEYAGRHVQDLSPYYEASVELGEEISALAVEQMKPYSVMSYGKAAIVGLDGEQEHGVALLTTPYGNVLREAAGGGSAWISSATKRAQPRGVHRHPAGIQGCLVCALALRRHEHHPARRRRWPTRSP